MLRYLFVLGLATVLFTACGGSPEGQKVTSEDAVDVKAEQTAAAAEYNVSLDESMINWTGAKFSGDQHTGYLKLSSGKLMVENGNIVGGSFIVDMNSLTDTDLSPDDGKAKLEGHLKSDDFFHVEEFPTGKFEIAEVNKIDGNPDATHEIKGNLTLKGATKSITIPANVQMKGDKIMATTPSFVINRTEWDVMYGSGLLGVAQDKAIKDEVGLKVNLVASK
ncbi:MAG: YceI family protein [Saprospiraceae bacterium]|nr:YceI family protein [Saprospiraceae bacterium]